MPPWVHTVFLDLIPRWLFMRRPAPNGRRRRLLLLQQGATVARQQGRSLAATHRHTGPCLSTSASWLQDGDMAAGEPQRPRYEDLELGTLSSYFSFRPPSPRPPGSTPPPQPKHAAPQGRPEAGGGGVANRKAAVGGGGRGNVVRRATKVDKMVSDVGFPLSPSVLRALEGVHYIADHLRATARILCSTLYSTPKDTPSIPDRKSTRLNSSH